MESSKTKLYGTSVFTQRTREKAPGSNIHKSQFQGSKKSEGTPGASKFIFMGNRRIYTYNEK